MNPIVITRHTGLMKYLVEQGIVPNGTTAHAYATPDIVAGQHVIGVLPLSLSALAASVTVIPLNVPPALRGQELDLEQVREFAGPAQTFTIRETVPLWEMIAGGSGECQADCIAPRPDRPAAWCVLTTPSEHVRE